MNYIKNLAKKAYANALMGLAYLTLMDNRSDEEKMKDSLMGLEMFGTSYDKIQQEMFWNMKVAEKGKDFVNRVERIKRNQQIRSYCIDTMFESGKKDSLIGKIAYQAPVKDFEVVRKYLLDHILNNKSAGAA